MPTIVLTSPIHGTTETSVTINYALSGFSPNESTLLTAFINNNVSIDDYRSVATDITIAFDGTSTGSIVIDTLVKDVEYSVLVRVLNQFQNITVMPLKKLPDAPILPIGEKNGGVTKFSGEDGSIEIKVSWTPLSNDDPSYVPSKILILWKTLTQSIQYSSFDIDASNIIQNTDPSNIIQNPNDNSVFCIVKLINLPTDEYLEVSGLLTNDYGDTPLSIPVLKVLIPSILGTVNNIVVTQNLVTDELLVEFGYPQNQFEIDSLEFYKFADTEFKVTLTFTFDDDTYTTSTTLSKTITDNTDHDETQTVSLDISGFLDHIENIYGGISTSDVSITVESISNDYDDTVVNTNTKTIPNTIIQNKFGTRVYTSTSTVTLANSGVGDISATVELNFDTNADKLLFLTVHSLVSPTTRTTKTLTVNITAIYDEDITKTISQDINLSGSELSTTFIFSNTSFGVTNFFGDKVSFKLTTSVENLINPSIFLEEGLVITLKPALTIESVETTGNTSSGNPTGIFGNNLWKFYGQTYTNTVSKLELFVKIGSSISKNYYSALTNYGNIYETDFTASKLPSGDDFIFGVLYTFGVFVTYTDTTTEEVEAASIQYGYTEYTFNTTNITILEELDRRIVVNARNFISNVITPSSPSSPKNPLSTGIITVKIWISTSTINTTTDTPFINSPLPHSNTFLLSDLNNGTVYNIVIIITLTFPDSSTFTSDSIILTAVPRTGLTVIGRNVGPTYNGEKTTFSTVINPNGLTLRSYQYLGIPHESVEGTFDLDTALVKGISFRGISSGFPGSQNLNLTFTNPTNLESVILFLTASLDVADSSDSDTTVDSIIILFNIPRTEH